MKPVGVVFLAVLFLAGCASSEGQMRIGVVAPLTGDFGSLGADILRGVELAREDLGVEVVYEDACLPKESSVAVTKLVNVDRVDLISGVFCIVSVEPLLAVTEPQELNVMMVASVPDEFIDLSDNLYSTNFAIRDEAAAQGEFAANELGAKSAAILYINNAFGQSYKRNFAKRFEKLGGSIVSSESLDIYAGEFRTPLAKAAASDPDAILVVHLGTELGLLLKQASELGIKTQFIGTYEAEDAQVLNVAGPAAEGFIISSLGPARGGSADSFRERFLARYGEEPTPLARNAYDGLHLQVAAFRECEGEPSCMRGRLLAVEDYDGASGIFSISDDGTAERRIIFKQVRMGRFEQYG